VVTPKFVSVLVYIVESALQVVWLVTPEEKPLFVKAVKMKSDSCILQLSLFKKIIGGTKMNKKPFDFEISPFVHMVSLSDTQYEVFYNALTLGMVVVRNDVVQALKNDIHRVRSATVCQLCSAKILVSTEEIAFRDLERAKKFLQKKIIGVLCLMLTESCNLRCRYCFIEHKFPVNHVFNSLTPEMAKDGIDVFVKHLPKSLENGLEDPTISFYGGEPLLNLPTLKWALNYIAYLKDKGKIPSHVFLALNTNGTVVSPEIAKLLKKHNVSASVSVDGPQIIHDRGRPDILGKGSFQKVLKGIAILRAYGVDVGISCAVAMHNLKYLEEISEWFIEQIGVDVFGFNILLDGGLPDPDFNLIDYSTELGHKMVECFKIARKKGKQEERSFRLARSFAEGRIHYYDCSACGQQLVVDPCGRFGPCHAYLHSEKNFIPPNKEIDLFSHPLWEEWRFRSPINMKQCQGCIALGICGGGCPYNAESRKGSIWKLDESFCPFARSMTRLLIKEVGKKVLLAQD